MNQKIFLITSLIILNLSCFGQKTNFKTECELVDSFLNSHEVISWFGNINKSNDSTLFLFEYFGLLGACEISSWNHIPVTIVTAGTIIDSIKQYDFHFLFKKHNNYYVVYASNKNDDITIAIRRSSDNLICTLYARKSGNYYYIISIEKGVI